MMPSGTPGAERVDRRIVDGDDADIAFFLKADQFALAFSHFTSPRKI